MINWGMPYVGGRNGIVAAASPLAATEGLRVLMDGGNAIDAAIVTAAILSVDEPYFSGPGGHGILLMYDAAAKQVRCLDFGGFAPHAFTIDQWGTPPAYPQGSVQSTIFPALLAGWSEALATYGSISLEDALQPVVEHARKGVVMRPVVASYIRNIAPNLAHYPELARIFMPDDRVPRAGELIRYPALGESFRVIAKEGVRNFYEGTLAERMVDYLNKHGSLFTPEEFKNYRPRWRPTITTTYRDRYEIVVPRCQSCSPCILTQLNVWEQFDLQRLGLNTPDSVHLGIEAAKVSFNDRRNLCGDPDFHEIPYERLASKDYAREIVERIKLSHGASEIPGDEFENKPGGTTHLTVVDRHRNAVAITQTLGPDFGCLHVVPQTGIILNSEGLYFDLEPEGGPNYPEPGKLSQHDMSPTIVLRDGELFLALGAPGAQGITQTIPQVISKVIDHNMGIQSAIESGRYRYYGRGKVQLDEDIAAQAKDQLLAKGHQVLPPTPTPIWAGAFNAVSIDPTNGTLAGGADPRRGGLSVGY